MFHLVLGDHVFPDVVMPGSLAEQATYSLPVPVNRKPCILSNGSMTGNLSKIQTVATASKLSSET